MTTALQGQSRIEHAEKTYHGRKSRNVQQPQTANYGYSNHTQGKTGNGLNIAAEQKHKQDNKKGDIEHGRSLPQSAL